MHTFPDLNSIFSLPVVVVVCFYAHIHVIAVSCTGKSGSGTNWGSGMWDPFLGGRGEGVSIHRKICCIIFRGKMMPLIMAERKMCLTIF